MAENKSSQDSLPLSQETYRHLSLLLDGPVSSLMEEASENADETYESLLNDMNRQTPMFMQFSDSNNDAYQLEVLQDKSNLPKESQIEVDSVECNRLYQPLSSLPASESWPGDFSFTLSFNQQKVTKAASWIYSNELNKLYVCKGVSCPINFSTNAPMPDVYVRAMALFTSSDHASEKVTRCVNHSIEEINKNVPEAEHLIRCENATFYQICPVTGRHSVVVFYENPPAGQKYSTYLYKFMCFNSCSGGPNRRALMVVFTLETRNGEVIGRQKVNLKVCACPVRDYNSDKSEKPVKRPRIQSVSDFPPILPKKEENGDKEYCIKVTDKKRYKFLKKMDTLYLLYTAMKSHPSSRAFLTASSQSSSEEMDLDKHY